MRDSITIKINFTGGVISPGDLLLLLHAAKTADIHQVSFGLRQQLLMDVHSENYEVLINALNQTGIRYEINADAYPNIVSSYPAEEVFISKNWLSEGVYKDIFDSFTYQPALKINISDNNQSLTPLLTGNINWVASANAHFWYLVIRFPKTNIIYHWKDLVYTNDIAALSQKIELVINTEATAYRDNDKPDGDSLYEKVMRNSRFIIKACEEQIQLSPFMLPYYEGFNRFQENKYWLGIYRRNEQFSIRFLEDLCYLCLATKVGQICSTPWKSLIIKGIEEKHRNQWDNILGKHQINVRHAANELNFQVEDNCKDGLALKQYLVKHLNQDDTRTFGICIGIKTRKKSEVFSSILIRKKPLFSIGGIGFLHMYDILCAKDFNPNERTGSIFSSYNFKFLLPEQLRRAIVAYYGYKARNTNQRFSFAHQKEHMMKETSDKHVHQCAKCLTIYDESQGDAEQNISAGTGFKALPQSWHCPLCESPKAAFREIALSSLFIQAG